MKLEHWEIFEEVQVELKRFWPEYTMLLSKMGDNYFIFKPQDIKDLCYYGMIYNEITIGIYMRKSLYDFLTSSKNKYYARKYEKFLSILKNNPDKIHET